MRRVVNFKSLSWRRQLQAVVGLSQARFGEGGRDHVPGLTLLQGGADPMRGRKPPCKAGTVALDDAPVAGTTPLALGDLGAGPVDVRDSIEKVQLRMVGRAKQAPPDKAGDDGSSSDASDARDAPREMSAAAPSKGKAASKPTKKNTAALPEAQPKAKKVRTTASTWAKPPTMQHEKSRSQILVRTGKGGLGSSKCFPYSKGGGATATAEAKMWLREQTKLYKAHIKANVHG